MKRAVISLSGGMDSTCLLVRMLAEGYKVQALSFYYGQNHVVELERLKLNLRYLQDNGHEIEHNFVDIAAIGRIFESGLLSGDIPQGHYEQENMKATVVPNRNAIFSSIIYGYGLSIAKKHKTEVDIFLGVHSGDHEIYPDCRPDFYNAIQHAFKIGNWDSEAVSFSLPYLHGNKTTILEDCLKNCDELGLSFDIVLQNTNTSYDPDNQGRSSGKSGADIERIEAFLNIGRKDPVPYVEPWEKVVNHARTVLQR